MFELNLRGDEQIIIDKSDNNRLKEVRGIHCVYGNGEEHLYNIKFYDAHILDDGSIECHYVYDDGENKLYEITIGDK